MVKGGKERSIHLDTQSHGGRIVNRSHGRDCVHCVFAGSSEASTVFVE